MAEVVMEMQERMLSEYEVLKKFNVCTDEQIRECIRMRERYQMGITQSGKTLRDYADFIIFEKKVHKWVNEKERALGKGLSGLKKSIATRIIRLYRDGLLIFPHEDRFWENYIQFSKKSVPFEVSGIYEKMLTFHGDKPSVWCDAALWSYEYSLNMAKVNEIFYRGLQRHPESETINKAFFDILLMEASKMNNEANSPTSQITEQKIGLDRVQIIYRSSKKKITNINYFLRLLERCEEEKFKNITAPLQKMICDDMIQLFPREEVLWDALAQRELRGFNMADLRNVTYTEDPSSDTISEKANAPTNVLNSIVMATETNATPIDEENSNADNAKDDSMANTKSTIVKSVWQQRTLKRRIELCCKVYQTAVRTLETSQMWTLYINAMLKLNQDMSTQQVLKRKRLAIAFKEGHESSLMSIDHYCTFVRMLIETPNGVPIAESVISDAIKTHKSLKLYELWLSTHIIENNEPKVNEIFCKAHQELGAESFPLWRLTLQFYKTRYDDCAKRLQKLYKKACEQLSPEFGVFRGEYLEFCIINMSMEKVRKEYDELAKLPPPCLELHQKMAQLESQLAVRTEADMDRWRLCYENAVYYFGKTHSQVWIDFIKFERDHGKPKRMSPLYDRAKHTLEPKLVDNFISEYTLLTTIISMQH